MKNVRIIHGSEDSLDLDVVYVFDKLPSFRECQLFCADKEENRNMIVVENGILLDCYKGTVDELNNGLYTTYDLHEQQFQNPIQRKVERDVLLKIIRVVRCFLSHFSRTQYRKTVKSALKSGRWDEKIEALRILNFREIDDYGKNGSKEDVHKVFAFQLGQALGLLENMELYTKSSISFQYPLLRQYLYREKNVNTYDLTRYYHIFLEKIAEFEVVQNGNCVEFKEFHKKMDLVKENYV